MYDNKMVFFLNGRAEYIFFTDTLSVYIDDLSKILSNKPHVMLLVNYFK